MIVKTQVWGFWAQGELPEFEASCVQSWRRHLAQEDFEITILDRAQATALILEHVPTLTKRKLDLMTHILLSELLRLVLLAFKGGVWMDVSIFLERSLSWLVDGKWQTHEFVSWSYPKTADEPIVSFMAAKRPGLVPVLSWVDTFVRMIEEATVGDKSVNFSSSRLWQHTPERDRRLGLLAEYYAIDCAFLYHLKDWDNSIHFVPAKDAAKLFTKFAQQERVNLQYFAPYKDQISWTQRGLVIPKPRSCKFINELWLFIFGCTLFGVAICSISLGAKFAAILCTILAAFAVCPFRSLLTRKTLRSFLVPVPFLPRRFPVLRFLSGMP